MTHQEIDTLLNRFLSAQTTEAEEQTLADYFQNAESVPEEWQPYRELFLSFLTDAYELTDNELAALTAEPAPTKRKVRPLYWLGAAAACAARCSAMSQPSRLLPRQTVRSRAQTPSPPKTAILPPTQRENQLSRLMQIK